MQMFCENEGCKNQKVRQYRLTYNSNSKKMVCDECSSRPSIDGMPNIIEKEYLPGYGWESKARLNELDRRVILPIDIGDGSYYVGRRGNDGRISDKKVDIRR